MLSPNGSIKLLALSLKADQFRIFPGCQLGVITLATRKKKVYEIIDLTKDGEIKMKLKKCK